MTTIESAVLHFMQRDNDISNSVAHCKPTGGTALSFDIYRMVRDWGETPHPAENTWTGGGTYAFNKNALQVNGSSQTNWVTEGSATASFTQADDHWETVDVTDIVTAWWNHSKGVRSDAPNYGVIFVNTNETSSAKGVDIYSRDYTSGRTPYIVVTYNSNTRPNAVPETGRSPSGSSGSPTIVNTLTPTFSGQISDPDAGDYITRVAIKVYRSSDGVTMWDAQFAPTGHPTTFNYQYAATPTQLITPPVALVGNTKYHWACLVMDSGGLWSPWNQYDYFLPNTPPNAPTVSILETPSTDVGTLTPTVVITHNDPDPGDTVQHGYQIIVEKVGSTQVYDSGAVDLSSGEWATTKQIALATLTDPDDANAWGTSFRVKARTKDANNAWGSYSGWVTFTTHAAGAPISLAPADDEVAPTTTPTLTGNRANSTDVITSYQIILYDDSLTQIWDSGTLTTGISSGATFSKVYSGSALSTGAFYQWKARITSSVGGTSAYSALKRFKVQSDATVPTQTSPLGTGIQGGGSNPLRPAFVGQRTSSAFNSYQIEVYPSTATTANLGTPYYSSGTQTATLSGSGPWVFTLAADTVTALEWNTTYKWRARVFVTAGSIWSDWSGLASFTMDSAGTPTLTTPTNDQWITDSTPDFTITRAGTDTIDQMQVRVYASNGTTLIWDSTMTNVANATTGTITYAGTALTGGYYWWEARYQKTTNGPIGNWASKKRFRLNSVPSVPTELKPDQGEVLVESLLPVFEARFNDDDIAVVGDYPTEWEIVVELNDSPYTNKATITVTSGLLVGVNSYTYRSNLALGTQNTLSYAVDYRWKTRFMDSKGEWGAYSSYQTFRAAIQPNSTGMTPSEGSTVNVVRPTVTWTYDAQSGSDQYAIRLLVFKVVDNTATAEEKLAGTDSEILSPIANVYKIMGSSGFDYQFESNYFQNNEVYEIRLAVINADNLEDPTPQTNRVWVLLDAPDPITGLSPTAVEDRSVIELNWTAATMKTNHTFVAYNVYKRLSGDDEWTYIGSTSGRTLTTYDDWYAGQGVLYEYKLTVVTTKTGVGIELESGY